MEFMTKKISFKSLPEFYEKEKNGKKNNIVRIIDKDDERFEIIKEYSIFKFDLLIIEIKNTETKDSFCRIVKDITFFNDLTIITWMI